MKKVFFPLGAALCALLAVAVSRCTSDVEPDSYAVLAPAAFAEDAESWEGVVSSLQQRHQATVLRFEDSPMELEAQLRDVAPRYVAVVDVPENIGRDYVIALNQMSRRMDEDPYADFLWGIITGCDAAGAQSCGGAEDGGRCAGADGSPYGSGQHQGTGGRQVV